MLDVLDRMDGEQRGVLGGPFHNVSTYLRDVWTAGLSAAGESQAVGEPEAKAVEARGAELYELLRKEFPALVYDRWWKKVPGMAERLSSDVPASKKPEPDDELVDLLNASWMARMNDIEQGGGSPDHVRTIGERAMSIGEQIAARKG
jgi:hypothetical protein